MENPWFNFNPPEGGSRFHDLDKAHAIAFNKGMSRQEYKLAEHLEPFPYLGNPDAKVVVLLANPFATEEESLPSFRIDSEQEKQLRRNLVHLDLDSSQSKFHSPAVSLIESIWHKPRIKELVSATSLDQVAQGIFFVNYHAYNSKSWQPIPFTFETQRYSFNLVNKAIERNSLIIMSRNKLGWFTAVPDLFDYNNKVMMKSSRGVYLSEGNLGKEVFNEILNRL